MYVYIYVEIISIHASFERIISFSSISIRDKAWREGAEGKGEGI